MCASNKKKQRFKKRKLKVLKKNSILPDYADFFSLIEFPLFVVLCFNHRAYITKAYYEIFFLRNVKILKNFFQYFNNKCI